VVAAFGALLLGTIDVAGGLVALDRPSRGAARANASDFATAFAWVFIAAGSCLAVALVALGFVEERPLRGPAVWTEAAQDDAPRLAAE
jgi:hypothetical protein